MSDDSFKNAATIAGKIVVAGATGAVLAAGGAYIAGPAVLAYTTIGTGTAALVGGSTTAAVTGLMSTKDINDYLNSPQFATACESIGKAILSVFKTCYETAKSIVQSVSSAVQTCLKYVLGKTVKYIFRPLKQLVCRVWKILRKAQAITEDFVKVLFHEFKAFLKGFGALTEDSLKQLSRINKKDLEFDRDGRTFQNQNYKQSEEKSEKKLVRVCEICGDEKPLKGGSDEKLPCKEKCGNWRHLGCYAQNNGNDEEDVKALPFKCALCAD